MHSFHAKLKTIYLNGKVNRRIDFLIDALLKIEKDTFFKYMGNKVAVPKQKGDQGS